MDLTKLMFNTMKLGLVPFFRSMYEFHVEGKWNLPEGGGVVVSNHTGYLDPAAITAGLHPHRPRFVARDFRSYGNGVGTKLFNFIYRTTGQIVLPRKQGKGLGRQGLEQSLEKVQECLSAGDYVVIFPEGKRTEDGELGRFNRGFLKIAKEADKPIIPVYLEGTYDAWPKCRPIFKFHGKGEMRIGEAFNPKEASVEDVRNRVLELKEGHYKTY